MTQLGDERVAVLLMAYGSPRTPEEIEPYYTDIRRGRPPTAEQLAELTARYAVLGGTSPLAALTEAQRAALQAALDAIRPGRFDVVLGFKHSDPKIEAAVDAIAAKGYRHLVGLVLAPHYSAMSVGEYLHRARAAAAARGIAVDAIDSWATEPAYVTFLARVVSRSMAELAAERDGVEVHLVFTAHSLPSRVTAMGDPYAHELEATAAAVAAELGLPRSSWRTGWQSAARTGEPWLGPDITEIIDAVADEPGAGRRAVVVCACGFVSDHLEILYDLDVVAADRAQRRGVAFRRTASMNDDPDVIAALARRVDGAVGGGT